MFNPLLGCCCWQHAVGRLVRCLWVTQLVQDETRCSILYYCYPTRLGTVSIFCREQGAVVVHKCDFHEINIYSLTWRSLHFRKCNLRFSRGSIRIQEAQHVIPNNYALVNRPCLESDILFQPQLRQQPRSLQMSDWLRGAFGLAYRNVLVSFVLLMQSWSIPSRSQPRASLRTVELRPSWVANVFCVFWWVLVGNKTMKNYCLSCLQLDIRSRRHRCGRDCWRHAVGRGGSRGRSCCKGRGGPLTLEGADGEFRAGTSALDSWMMIILIIYYYIFATRGRKPLETGLVTIPAFMKYCGMLYYRLSYDVVKYVYHCRTNGVYPQVASN